MGTYWGVLPFHWVDLDEPALTHNRRCDVETQPKYSGMCASLPNKCSGACSVNVLLPLRRVQTIMCPMKSFRIPVCNMKMSEEALDSALCVDTLLKARQFLDTFGSHVSNGRHLLGGIFFRTITMTSESEVITCRRGMVKNAFLV